MQKKIFRILLKARTFILQILIKCFLTNLGMQTRCKIILKRKVPLTSIDHKTVLLIISILQNNINKLLPIKVISIVNMLRLLTKIMEMSAKSL